MRRVRGGREQGKGGEKEGIAGLRARHREECRYHAAPRNECAWVVYCEIKSCSRCGIYRAIMSGYNSTRKRLVAKDQDVRRRRAKLCVAMIFSLRKNLSHSLRYISYFSLSSFREREMEKYLKHRMYLILKIHRQEEERVSYLRTDKTPSLNID